MLPDPSTETIGSSLEKYKAMEGNHVILYKSIDEMKDMVLAFVLNHSDLTFSVYANGQILTLSNSMKDVTFDIVNGSFSPFIRTAGAGIHVKSVSNFPMPIALPGINLFICRLSIVYGMDNLSHLKSTIYNGVKRQEWTICMGKIVLSVFITQSELCGHLLCIT